MPIRIADTYSYRHAEAILTQSFRNEHVEILQSVISAAWVPMAQPKERKRNGRTVARLDIDQIGTNKSVESQFLRFGWSPRRRIVSNAGSHLVADFNKGAVQVEVQFGNAARWYADVFKFLLSYAANDIEVGVLVVPMRVRALRIDENVVTLERVVRELPHAKMAVTLPVLVLGVD